MSKICRSRGCNWPVNLNEDICAECAEVGTPAEKRMAAKVNERQRELLLSFKHSHDEGTRSPPYYVPFGMTGLQLAGSGQAMSGLLKRGLVQDRNNIYYITEAGIAALG